MPKVPSARKLTVAVKQRRFVVGIDLGGTSAKAGLVDSRGHVLERRDTALDPSDKSPRAVFGLLQKLVSGLGERVTQKRALLGVGLLVPAPVDAERGVVVKAANLGREWTNVGAGRFLQSRTQLPVMVENDANGFAFGSWYYDFQRRPDHLIGITLGTGVGGGIILNRKIWYGDTGVAGEIGHYLVRHSLGEACGCGSRGCLEQYASASAIPRVARQLRFEFPDSPLRRQRHLSGADIARAARQGDPLARATFRRIGEDLGQTVASLINTFGILTYSFGGKGARSFRYFGPALRERVTTHCDYLGPTLGGLTLRPTKLGDDAAVMGAASLVFEKSLQP